MKKPKPHPMQPIEKDEHGVPRFKRNAIVEHLLTKGGIDLNAIAGLPFSREDRIQFAQLIGYSVSGFGGLSYVDADTAAAADLMAAGKAASEEQARVAHLQGELDHMRAALRGPMARLFAVHPDDLGEGT